MKTPTTPEELYNTLKKRVGKKPVKMSEIAVKLGYINDGDKVPSSLGARIRLQLNKLIDEGVVVREGARSTAVYRKA